MTMPPSPATGTTEPLSLPAGMSLPARRLSPRTAALIQGVVPGAAAILSGRTASGVATLCLWPVTIITTHMRIVGGLGSVLDGNVALIMLRLLLWPVAIVTTHSPAAAGVTPSSLGTGIWLALLALLWLNLVVRAYTDARTAPGTAVLPRRPVGQLPSQAAWLVTRNWLVLAGGAFLVDRMALDAEVDLREFFRPANIRALRRIASGLVHPDFSITREVIARYAWVTLEMAVIGTILGSLVSAPISVLGARNLLGHSPTTAWLYYVTRFVLSVVRSIPTLIWGLMAISFGLGHFPGVIALSIFSFGLTAKLFSEAIEGIDWGPVEAVTAGGANPLHTLIFGVVPQVAPYFVSHFLYCLEVNVHSSVVLGLIGAGGLGLIVNEYIATFHWEQASTVLLVTITMTLGIDYGSAYIRSRIV